MLRVVEMFSGIGSQAKALRNLGVEHKIVATVEWDVGACYAYDIIHNGKQNISELENYNKTDLLKKLEKFELSSSGKAPISNRALKSYSEEALRKIYYAIKRTNNLANIKKVHASDLPENIDIITYSFPCQDLSLGSAWHGNTSGINRGVNNRSGMLWEVERILMEYQKDNKKKPKVLLMENVSNILSKTHVENFNEWKEYLNSIGYENKVFIIDAMNVGIPQKRKRVFMVSFFCELEEKRERLKKNLKSLNFENKRRELIGLENFLKIDYRNCYYFNEAEESNPNDTSSRKKIYDNNIKIIKNGIINVKNISTITTKQDRHPNSGVIDYCSKKEGKSKYRNLTPRECFLLMGFSETDFQVLKDNDFYYHKNKYFFNREKLIKLAGNSIVVPVLEEIFKEIIEILELLK